MATKRQTETVPPAGRVLLALADAAHAELSFELAGLLARMRGCELLALLLQDPAFETLAALPFVREVDRATGALRQLDSERLNTWSTHLVRRCAEQIERLTMTGTFTANYRCVPGKLRTAFEYVEASDVLVLSPADQAPRWRATAPGRLRLALLFGSAARDATALAIGTELSRRQSSRLSVIVEARSDTNGARARKELAALRAQAGQATLEAARVVPSLASALEAAGHERAHVVVLSRAQAEADRPALERFLEVPQRVVIVTP